MKSNLDYSKSPLVLGVPWITFEGIDYLINLIKPDMKVFEFGSGGSTKFFVSRVKEIHSVEHDKIWFNLVKKETGGFHNLKLNLKKGEEKPFKGEKFVSDEDDDPLDYGNYANMVLDFDDQYFDLIFIDGKARKACIKNAIPKLKNGGYLILDNSNRRTYADTLSIIEQWLKFRSFGPSVNSKKFTQTSFFRKPENGL
ncbi:MAG: hypothetical protein WD431_02105 [Cyclobacteriaceae bacterium]